MFIIQKKQSNVSRSLVGMGGFMNIYQNVLSPDIQVWYNDIVIFVSVFWVKSKNKWEVYQ